MYSKDRKPHWLKLYLLLPLLILLFSLQARLAVSNGVHELLELGVLCVVYGLAAHWIASQEYQTWENYLERRQE